MEQVRYLEELFTVPTEKLKQITDHFVSELAKGSYCLPASYIGTPANIGI
jgi:hexokinase